MLKNEPMAPSEIDIKDDNFVILYYQNLAYFGAFVRQYSCEIVKEIVNLRNNIFAEGQLPPTVTYIFSKYSRVGIVYNSNDNYDDDDYIYKIFCCSMKKQI